MKMLDFTVDYSHVLVSVLQDIFGKLNMMANVFLMCTSVVNSVQE